MVKRPLNHILHKNDAKIEFLAHLENISSKKSQGWDGKRIFQELQAAQSITMSYSAFCYHCRLHFPASKKLKKRSINIIAETRSKSGAFVHDKAPDFERLVFGKKEKD